MISYYVRVKVYNGSITMSFAEQSGCADHDAAAALEKYYNDIKSCLHDAASSCIPSVKLSSMVDTRTGQTEAEMH